MPNINELLAQIDNTRRMLGQNALATFQNPVQHFENSLARYAQENLPSKMDAQDAMSVMPGMGDAMKEKVNALAMNAWNPAMTVWHGSPHLFDKFDSAKIGTGEGAQSYGHGIYVAEKRNTGEFYRKSIGDAPSQFKVNGEKFDPSNPVHRITMEANFQGATPSSVIESLKKRMTHPAYNKEDIVASLKAAQEGRFGKWEEYLPERGGALYKVDLPDEHIAKMLDWDKPLSEQPKNVQKAMQEAGYGFPDSTGGDIVRGATQFFGGPEKASGWLSSVGIPGIKYLDQGSRNKGDGTRNFVVFDDKLLNILGRE